MSSDASQSDTHGRLAIVAGRGRLPIDIARATLASGYKPFVIALRGEADQIPPNLEHESIGVGDGRRLVEILKENSIDRVILSGGVKRRPELRELRLSFRLLAKVLTLARALTGSGDDKLLRVVVSMIETSGCRVIGVRDVAPDLLAETGPQTKKKPDKLDWKNITVACAGANALGALDVGQGAVAVGGRIVALEGAEGTDSMLDRVAQLKQEGRISQRKRGALVKLCKPQQDERVDLPSIGPATVINAHRAGLSGIALDAGRSLILDREQVVLEADRLGLFVFGIDRDEVATDITAGLS
ncbi:MAG: UDP-2,3-diacylglucosamine diphosphatase LpxI [Pseudomonadota bacterium]